MYLAKVKDTANIVEGFAQKEISAIAALKVWQTHALGDRAESDLFHALEKMFTKDQLSHGIALK